MPGANASVWPTNGPNARAETVVILTISTRRVQRGPPFERAQPDQQHPLALSLVQVGLHDVPHELATDGRLPGDQGQIVGRHELARPHLEPVKPSGAVE